MLKRKTKRIVVVVPEKKEGVTEGMGRKRIPPEELMRSICINLKQKILDEIAKDGTPKKVIEEIITQKYSKE